MERKTKGKVKPKAKGELVPKMRGKPPLKTLTEPQWRFFEDCCRFQSTLSEICSYFDLSDKTLYRLVETRYSKPYSETYKRFSENGLISLRRAQFRAAVIDGNISMQIWLGKQLLGQREPKDITLAIDSKDIEELFDNNRDPLNPCQKLLELTPK